MALTYFHFFCDLEVLMDDILDFHHKHLSGGTRDGLHHYLHLVPGTRVLLSLLLAPFRLSAGLLLVLGLGFLWLHLQLSADVNPGARSEDTVKALRLGRALPCPQC